MAQRHSVSSTTTPTAQRLYRKFRRREEGGALVEFAVSLPLILIIAFLSVDSMRLFWSYQAAIAGVRDATRYLARIAPDDICNTGGSVASYTTRLENIVATTIGGNPLFPSGIRVTSVTPALSCITTLGLRQASVPVATVSANLTISMPFSQIMRIVGLTSTATITTTVRDQARVYGL